MYIYNHGNRRPVIVIVITIEATVVSANAIAKKEFRTINISANREMERIHLNRFNYRLPIKSNLSLFTIFSEIHTHTHTHRRDAPCIHFSYFYDLSLTFNQTHTHTLSLSIIRLLFFTSIAIALCVRQYVLVCAVSWLLAIYGSVLLRLFSITKRSMYR